MLIDQALDWAESTRAMSGQAGRRVFPRDVRCGAARAPSAGIFSLKRRCSSGLKLTHYEKNAYLALWVYNVFNANSVLGVINRYRQAWLTPTGILQARFVKFGVQVDF